MIYLDNGATTFPKPECVYQETDRFAREGAVNAGRGAYKAARRATEMIREVKTGLLSLVDARGQAEVALTPSVTIALNQIIQGQKWKEGMTAYVTPYEHNAVARTLEVIQQKEAIRVELLPIKTDSLEIDLEKTRYLFAKEKPKAVCCTHVSNVTGYALPVKEIADMAKEVGAVVVIDASQSFGLLEIDINMIHADFIVFAGHKTPYGPFGVGGFIDADTFSLNTVFAGGTGSDSLNLKMPTSSPEKYEYGSKNIVAIAGLNQALKCLDQEKNYKHERKIVDYLFDKLSTIPEVVMYVSSDELDKHIGLLSFNLKGYKSDEVGTILSEDYGIAVRTGFHCAPYIHDVLKDKDYLGTVRVGVSQFTSEEDIDSLYNAIVELV